jgi:hypothetical protein
MGVFGRKKPPIEAPSEPPRPQQPVYQQPIQYQQPVQQAPPVVQQVRGVEYKIVEVPTQTQAVIVNQETGEQMDVLACLAHIMGKVDKIERLIG